MLNLLLLSCQALTEAKTPSIPEAKPVPPPLQEEALPEVQIPAGRAVLRECYADSRRDRQMAGSPPPPQMASRKGSSRSASKSAPSPAPSGSIGTGGPVGGSTSEGYGAGPASAAPTAAPSMDAAGMAAPAEEGRAPSREAETKNKERSKDDASFRAEQAEATALVNDANLDWGATIYLSNDDSMSLASAQRLLWAIQNKANVTTSQVRPHELLNYFSFETDEIPRGDLFSVKGSAEQTEPGVMTFAFAVKGATPPRKPLDLTIVLDRSGSMSAEGRMDYLKRGLSKMESQLVRGDRVDLVLFDHEVCTPLENFVVGRDDPAILTSAIRQLEPRGSTNLDLGLKEGYRIANGRTDAGDRNRRMMLVSDALLNTGDIDPNTVSEVAKAYESSNIRLTAIGVGRDFNDKVLDMLTEKGKGAYVYLGSEAVVDRVFGIGFPSLVQTIAHDVRFALDLPPSLAMKKFYGEESSTDPEDVQPIHYYAGTTQLFLQDLQLRGKPVPNDPVTLTIEWKDADSGAPMKQAFTTTVGKLLESDPRNMRKARALMAWTDLILARTLGNAPCAAPFTAWRERVDRLGEDAEIQWLDGLTSPLCGAEPVVPRAPVRGVAFKVKVDSDLPIAEVGLTCSGRTQTESLSGSDTVARFAAATPGSCTLMLQGNVPMQAKVEVPQTGGEVRCTVRGGRVSCG